MKHFNQLPWKTRLAFFNTFLIFVSIGLRPYWVGQVFWYVAIAIGSYIVIDGYIELNK
jgi:hypothetical protein